MVSKIKSFFISNSRQIFILSASLNAILLILFLVVKFPSGTTVYANTSSATGAGTDNNINISAQSNEATNTRSITFEIVGQVNNPGVYIGHKDLMVLEAIDLAGGVTENADLKYLQKNINLSSLIQPNQKIFIPSIGELSTFALNPNPNSSSSANDTISVNSASLTELESLPGIGVVIGQRIISGRPYTAIEDLKNISGITDKVYNEIVPSISL
jgi:competence protein ComEA